jgi:hypothetical protein
MIIIFFTLNHNFSFYNQHSSFTHSGVDPDASKEDGGLVIGQKNIHDKIQQMNFRDCHAKISHVDAQATLGDGVVVQVFGELSNDGHQMRRFTQTFVLACQSPKKYYVHNDIFRYHDIYCEDEDQREEHELVGTDSTGATSTNSTDISTTAASMMVQSNVFYPAPTATVIPVNASTGYPAAAVQAAPATVPSPQVNGMHEEMLKNMATQTSQSPQIIAAAAQAPQVLPIAPAPTALPIPVEPVAVNLDIISKVAVTSEANNNQYDADQSNEEDSDTLDNSKEMDINSSEDNASKSDPSPAGFIAPKNWANLVKAGPGIGFTGAPPTLETAGTTQPQSFIAITQQQQQQAQQQKQADNYGSVDRRQNPTRMVTSGSDRERRVSNNASNNNNNNDGSSQLFLGNLPTSATDEELRNLFSVFGKIADLRIHTKQTQKGSNGRPVPNYGFITFVDPSSCQRLQEAQV